jgi:Sec-independent protein translocase protein TatA
MQELLVIALVALFVLGPERLPVVMRTAGRLLTRVRKQDGANISAHVGGACVQMMQGTLRLEGEG